MYFQYIPKTQFDKKYGPQRKKQTGNFIFICNNNEKFQLNSKLLKCTKVADLSRLRSKTLNR